MSGDFFLYNHHIGFVCGYKLYDSFMGKFNYDWQKISHSTQQIHITFFPLLTGGKEHYFVKLSNILTIKEYKRKILLTGGMYNVILVSK